MINFFLYSDIFYKIHKAKSVSKEAIQKDGEYLCWAYGLIEPLETMIFLSYMGY